MKVDSRIRQRNFGYSARTWSSGSRATCGAGRNNSLNRLINPHCYVVQYTLTGYRGQSFRNSQDLANRGRAEQSRVNESQAEVNRLQTSVNAEQDKVNRE